MTSSRNAISTFIVALALTITGCASTPAQESFGEQIDDSVITSKVKTLFVEDKTVSALKISVETFKGTVQLSGFAGSPHEIYRAGEIAQSVKGVTGVKNDIILRTSAAGR